MTTPSTPAQPIYNPWRESLENCISGDNYLRASEYRDLIAELDELYRLRAAAPQPAQEPVAWCNRAAYDAMRAGVGPTVAILRERPGFHMALYAAPTQAAPVAELVEALEDLLLNVLEAMKTGGWVPTPLHRSFWDATNNAQGALARYQEAKP